MSHGWPPLTAVLKDRHSAIRRFLEDRLPHIDDLQRQYRDEVGPLIVPESTVNYGTLGGAFDWMVRFMLHPRPDLHLAHNGVALSGSRTLRRAFDELSELVGVVATGESSNVEPVKDFQGPMPASDIDSEVLARACWALALLTEVFRAGLRPESPLLTLDPRGLDAEDLLSLAPNAALRQLGQLRRAAEAVLLPRLSSRLGPWTLGPTFDGSVIMSADADVIAAGLLLEIKTSLGRKRRDGIRQASLDKQTILQLLGYTLLDFSDSYRISQVGLYAGRYAHLATWDLPRLLNELGGRQVDLKAERAAFRDLLLSGPPQNLL